MRTERLAKIRGFHSLQTVLAFALFLGINFCYGISYQKALEDSRALIDEVSSADQVELEEVFSAERTGGGWTQGFTVTDKYYVVVTTVSDGDNFMTAYDKKTFEEVRSVRCDIGHGNDLTYNSNTNEIVALGGSDNMIKFFDADTLEEMPMRQIMLGVDVMPASNANGIAYNADLDEYYIVSPKTGIRIWGGDFIPTNISYKIESPFNLYQTLSYHKGSLFYGRGCHVNHGICEHGDENDDNLDAIQGRYAPSSGAVIVYNVRTGRRESVFYIPPMNSQDRYYGEFEGVSIDEKNSIYFLYSSYSGDLPSIGDNNTFVVFKLSKDNKLVGNAKLKKILNRKSGGNTIDSGITPLRKRN